MRLVGGHEERGVAVLKGRESEAHRQARAQLRPVVAHQLKAELARQRLALGTRRHDADAAKARGRHSLAGAAQQAPPAQLRCQLVRAAPRLLQP